METIYSKYTVLCSFSKQGFPNFSIFTKTPETFGFNQP